MAQRWSQHVFSLTKPNENVDTRTDSGFLPALAVLIDEGTTAVPVAVSLQTLGISACGCHHSQHAQAPYSAGASEPP